MNSYLEDGYVSIWLGICNGYDELDEYLTADYDEDGEAINSRFAEDFQLRFDEDCREADVADEASGDIEELLEGFSAYDAFIDEAKASLGNPLTRLYNAAVLLYDFKYDGDSVDIQHEGLSLDFIGSFKFNY